MFKFSCYLFVLIICVINISLSAKTDSLKTRKATVEGSIMIGYAQMNVQPLKRAIEDGIHNLDFPAKIIDNFPDRPFYSFEIAIIEAQSLILGLKYTMISTGARVSYADYSGEYKYDNILNCNQFGLNLKFLTETNGSQFRFDFLLGAGIVTGTLKSTESYNIAGLKQLQSYNVGFNYFYIEPGIRVYYLWSSIITGINGTFNIELKNKTNIKWSGLRAGLFLGYRI